MLASAPFVSVVVPTFRRFQPVLDTLAELLSQRYPRFEVVVIDQNPDWPPELSEARRTLAAESRVRWVRIERSGLALARNEGAMHATGEILLFVDDDVALVDDDFIARHVRNFADPTVAAVAGRELMRGMPIEPLPPLAAGGELEPAPPHPARSALESVLFFDRSSGERREVCTFCTCNGAIRRRLLLEAGGFDEGMERCSYGDDYDLALRLTRAGHRIIFDPTARLVHLKAPIGGVRTTDGGNPYSEREKVVSGAVLLFRYWSEGCRWHLFHGYVLRRSVLRRQNVVRPWRQPAAWLGTGAALLEGAIRARRAPVSRLAPPDETRAGPGAGMLRDGYDSSSASSSSGSSMSPSAPSAASAASSGASPESTSRMSSRS